MRMRLVPMRARDQWRPALAPGGSSVSLAHTGVSTRRIVQFAMATISSDDAHAYFYRWELVREARADELQRTSMDTKLQQLESLVASRRVFGPESDREQGISVVRERWQLLRLALGG